MAKPLCLSFFPVICNACSSSLTGFFVKQLFAILSNGMGVLLFLVYSECLTFLIQYVFCYFIMRLTFEMLESCFCTSYPDRMEMFPSCLYLNDPRTCVEFAILAVNCRQVMDAPLS